LPFEQREEGDKKRVALGEPWGELFDCAWVHFTGALPSGYDLPDMVLLINLSGEGLYVNRAGVPMQGLTAGATAFEFGTMPKHVLSLNEDMLLDGKVDIWI
jgi:alpha-mannosidase